jgi:O-antigen/teichoic acid export membrane protein
MYLASLPHNRQQGDRTLRSAFHWSALAKWGSQALSSVVMLVLARLLTPADFGLIGMAALITGLVTLITDGAFDGAILSHRYTGGDHLRQLNTLACIVGVIGTLSVALVRQPVAIFFGADHLRGLLALMALGVLINSFRTVPTALLLRDLQFRTLSVLELSQTGVQMSSSLLLAYLGWGYWSIALGSLLGAGFSTIVSLSIRPCGFSYPNIAALRFDLSISGQLLLTRLAWYVYSNADFFVAGRRLSSEDLGLYSMAWSIATLPVEKFSSIATRVTTGVFSTLASRPAELRRYLRLVTEGLSMVVFPLTIGLAVVSQPLTVALFDPRWRPLARPLALLALYGTLRSVVVLWPPILLFRGGARFTMWHSVAAALVCPACFLYGSSWGITGIALSWVLIYPPLAGIMFVRTMRAIDMSFVEFCAALAPASAASAVMCAVLLLMMTYVPWQQSTLVAVGGLIACGGIVYAAVLWLYSGKRLREILRFMLSAT